MAVDKLMQAEPQAGLLRIPTWTGSLSPRVTAGLRGLRGRAEALPSINRMFSSKLLTEIASLPLEMPSSL